MAPLRSDYTNPVMHAAHDTWYVWVAFRCRDENLRVIYFEKQDEMQQCSSESTQIHCLVRGQKVYPPSSTLTRLEMWNKQIMNFFILLLLLL